ncbi:hypothetical protein ACKWTF_016147 [Chironomus riparius]
MFDIDYYLSKCRFCWLELSSQDCEQIDDQTAEQYEFITSKQLVSSVKLSNTLCTNCITKISSYYEYKQELIEKQEKLLSLLTLDDQIPNSIKTLPKNELEVNIQLASQDESQIEEEFIEEIDQLDDSDINPEESPTIHIVKLETSDPIELDPKYKNQPPSCPHCCKTFVDKRKLKIHIEKFHEKRTRKCEYCDFNANSKSELLRHVKSNHLKENNSTTDVRICPDCGKILKGNNHLNFHIKTKHLKLTKYQCDLCGFRSYGKYEIRSHILIHHLPLELRKEYKCDLCPSILTTAMSLKTHKQHKHSGLKPHICIFCNKSYALKETLKSHIRNVHNGERKYKCPTCNKGFNSNPRLTDHINNTHGHKQEIPCDKCGKVFNSLRNLQTHSIYHLSPTLKCNSCDKMFYIKKNLREHQESVHLGITYQCDLCQRSFQSTIGLRRHTKSHCKG